MPRGHLNERYVQEVAIQWLANYYLQNKHAKAIVTVMEARVSRKSKVGYGRADGLIVSQLVDGKIFTASLEAKSARTKSNHRLNPTNHWLLHAGLIGATGFVLTVVTLGANGGWFWSLLVPVLVFVVLGFIFLAVTLNNSRYNWSRVVRQAMGYPADEHWIAVSTDLYNLLNDERNLFDDLCKRQEIGLLRVSPGRKVEIIIQPNPKKMPRKLGNFLDCYAKATEIRKTLSFALSEGNFISEPLVLEQPEDEIVAIPIENSESEPSSEESDSTMIS